MRNILILFLVSLAAALQCFAQNIVEPETCILSSIGKGSQPKSIDTNVIRFNCIKQFHKSAEPKSVPVNKALMSQVTLEWFPKMQTLGPPYYLNESVRINLKNNSSHRLIYVVAGITNKETLTTEKYKFYADASIEPMNVGYFSGSIISDEPISTMDEFAQKYSWILISVHGLPK
jgi:hypothetical protein